MGWGLRNFSKAAREEIPNYTWAAKADADINNQRRMEEQQAKADLLRGGLMAAQVYNYGMGDKTPIGDFVGDQYRRNLGARGESMGLEGLENDVLGAADPLPKTGPRGIPEAPDIDLLTSESLGLDTAGIDPYSQYQNTAGLGDTLVASTPESLAFQEAGMAEYAANEALLAPVTDAVVGAEVMGAEALAAEALAAEGVGLGAGAGTAIAGEGLAAATAAENSSIA
jgi:hypothetical protein